MSAIANTQTFRASDLLLPRLLAGQVELVEAA